MHHLSEPAVIWALGVSQVCRSLSWRTSQFRPTNNEAEGTQTQSASERSLCLEDTQPLAGPSWKHMIDVVRMSAP